MKKIPFIYDRQVRVLYEIQCYNTAGDLIARCYTNTKRRAEQVINKWKKHGGDASLRRMRKSEWFLINPADIEREER